MRNDELMKSFWETEEKFTEHEGLTDEERAADKFYTATTFLGHDSSMSVAISRGYVTR